MPSSLQGERGDVDSYIHEMRQSREELLEKITRSSEDIAGRCREAMEAAKENVATLFDDAERERVVAAYADKLRASREETLNRLEARQAAEREALVNEIKADVSSVMESVVEKLKAEIERASQVQREETARRYQEQIDSLLNQQHNQMKDFHESAIAALRDGITEHRAEAVRKYNEEMARFRDHQLQELAKVSLSDFGNLDDLDGDNELDVATSDAAPATPLSRPVSSAPSATKNAGTMT